MLRLVNGQFQVCVVSLVGVFRKGKSFLLNVFLRYLRLQSTGSIRAGADWLCTSEKLQGFHYAAGSSGVTSGILIWPEVFLLKQSTGEEVAVVLLDYEGTEDTDAQARNSRTFFVLALLLSSWTVGPAEFCPTSHPSSGLQRQRKHLFQCAVKAGIFDRTGRVIRK